MTAFSSPFEATRLFTLQGDTVRSLETHVGYVAADAAYLGAVERAWCAPVTSGGTTAWAPLP